MRPKERVATAMSGKKPDRVPVIPQICHPHSIITLDLDFKQTVLDVVRDPDLSNRLNFQCAKLYGVDGMRVFVRHEPAEVIQVDGVWYGMHPVTEKILGRIDFSGGGRISPNEEITLNTEEDIAAIPVPSADEIIQSGRLDCVRQIVEEAGDDLFISGAVGSFTTEFIAARNGKAQAMMDMLDRPDFCHMAQERAMQASIEWAKALGQVGVSAIYIGETFGGMMSPAQFQEMCVPYIKRFVEALKGTGLLTYLHICGNSRGILEMMADTGVDCIEPLDPLGGVEVEDAKIRVGDRVALMGGVHTIKLAHGSLDDVVSDCKRCLDEGASGGGYILACGDMLPTETSPEKVRTMVDMAHEYIY